MYVQRSAIRSGLAVLLFYCLILVPAAGVPAPAAAETPLHAQRRVNSRELDRGINKNVLIINSYHYGYSWSDGILEAVYRRFSSSDMNIRLHTLYL
ncbi:MAG: hypothetical protein U5N26_10795 [Candidatus Marinimicrobia bacterium]|nr:hypothetical protein [Candidatus Neomarinimicrobiota bacterium]